MRQPPGSRLHAPETVDSSCQIRICSSTDKFNRVVKTDDYENQLLCHYGELHSIKINCPNRKYMLLNVNDAKQQQIQERKTRTFRRNVRKILKEAKTFLKIHHSVMCQIYYPIQCHVSYIFFLSLKQVLTRTLNISPTANYSRH